MGKFHDGGVVMYFPMTAHPEVFYCFYTTATLRFLTGQKMQLVMLQRKSVCLHGQQ